jgi:small conductance mechanosensitive channel
MSITIDSMIDPRRTGAACQPPNRRSQVPSRLIPRWNLAPGSRLIPRWTRLLVDSLGPSAVHWRIYFGLNGREHSWLKVRSSVIRLVKRAFQEHGISIPDESREVIFPQGVPVTLIDRTVAAAAVAGDAGAQRRPPAVAPAEDTDAVSTPAEAGLCSEAVVIEAQARHAQPLQGGENLLPSARGPSAAGAAVDAGRMAP